MRVVKVNLKPVSFVPDDIPSRKHTYIIMTPLEPHFYTVKLGFTRVYIIFLIFAQRHRLWVLVRTASPSTHNLYFEQKYENIIFFLSENFLQWGQFA